MIVSVSGYKAVNNLLDYTESAIESNLLAAEELIISELSYDPVYGTVVSGVYSGNGTYRLDLGYLPIKSVEYLSINGTEINSNDYYIDYHYIKLKYGYFTDSINNVIVSFTKGYETMPSLITTTIIDVTTDLLTSVNATDYDASSSTPNLGSYTRKYDTNYIYKLKKLQSLKIVNI